MIAELHAALFQGFVTFDSIGFLTRVTLPEASML